MADSAQYNLSLVITANNKAIEEINKIWKSVDSVKWNVVQLSESTKKVLKWVWVAATAVAWSMVALWKSFVDSALETEPLQRSFERLSESAWIASDEMLDAMKKASKWTVSDTKLMSAANTALSLNVVKSADDMATLMEIARVKWQAMWRSMEEALDDIVRWLWRSSPMILDNLWIVIKQWEAQEEYAKQLWKTVNELTEAEKKQALVNAVVKQWKQELLEAWELELTMWEKLQIVNAQRENMKNTLWQALLPVLQKLLDKITPIIEKVSKRIEQNPELAVKIWLAITAVSWLLAVMSWLALALPWITTAIWILTNKFTLLWWAILWAYEWLKRLEDKVVSTEEKVAMYQWAIQDLEKQFQNWEISQEEFTEAVLDYKEKIQEAYEESETLWWYLRDELDDTLKVMTFDTDRRSQAMTDFWIIFTEVWNMFDNFAEYLIWTAILAREWFWKVVNTVWTFFDNLTATMINFTTKWVDYVMWKIDTLVSKLKSLIATAREAISAVWWAISNAASSARNTISSPFRAWWWDVYSWQSYIVWENWPELFVPSQRWSIVPNNQITNNNWIEINISWVSVRNDNDINLITDEIIRKIKLEKNYWII